MAVNEKGEVIGGIFTSMTPDDDMTQQAGQPYSQYQFDVVVHPAYQRQGVGKMLIQAAEKERHDYETGYDTKAYTSLQVVNPNLHNYLTQQGGYEVDYEPPEGSEGNFMSKLRKWMKK